MSARASSGLPAIVLPAGLAVAHAVATWGHVTPFWGDYGKWLYEAQQVARGAALYRDVYWPQLPLAGWITGGWMRVVGEDLTAVWVLTLVVYALVITAFLQVVRRTVAPGWQVVTSLAGVLLMVSLAQVESAPLPMGMYTPAAPVGGLLLVWAVVPALGLALGHGTSWSAAAAGSAAALASWSKVDFAPPALALVAFLAWRVPRHRWPLVAGFALSGTLVLIAVAMTVPVDRWVEMALGFGQAAEFAGRGLPRADAVAAELVSTALWVVVAGGAVRRVVPRGLLGIGLAVVTLAAAAALFVVGTYPEGVRAGSLELVQLVASRPIPLVAPLVALAIVWRRGDFRSPAGSRECVMAMLALVAVAARGRRMFQHMDWYQLMLELPLYAMLLAEMVARAEGMDPRGRLRPRPATLLAWVTLALALMTHWSLGRGPFTHRAASVAVATARGTIHASEEQARLFEQLRAQLDAADPAGVRPLFGFGYSGGLNYFLARENPTALTQGFRFPGLGSADSAIARLERVHDALLLVENPRMEFESVPPTLFAVLRGDRRARPNVYTRVDRPIFDRLAVGCHPVTGADRRGIHLLDCRP